MYDSRPLADEWRLTDEECLIAPHAYERLPIYDCSIPTGVVPGKVWRRRDADGVWLGEYVESEPGFCRIVWRALTIVLPLRGPVGQRVLPPESALEVDGHAAWGGYPDPPGVPS